jgi:hypothetical protein
VCSSEKSNNRDLKPSVKKGSHIRFVHPDGRKTTIPDHGNRDVPQGLLIKIVRYDLKMGLSEFFKDG